MVIDLILDRKDGQEYSAKKFYDRVSEYEAWTIAEALDNGTEENVKASLCNYIIENGYPVTLFQYINSVDWIND